MFVTGKGLIGAKVCFFGGSHYKRMEMKAGLFTIPAFHAMSKPPFVS